jgi:hypothetical protein
MKTLSDEESDWPLVDPFDDGIRPAGAPDACLYCWQKVGQPHRRDCVVVKKRVRFRLTVELDLDVPHHWSADQIVKETSPWEFLAADDPLGEADSYGSEYIGVVDETPRRELRGAN